MSTVCTEGTHTLCMTAKVCSHAAGQRDTALPNAHVTFCNVIYNKTSTIQTHNVYDGIHLIISSNVINQMLLLLCLKLKLLSAKTCVMRWILWEVVDWLNFLPVSDGFAGLIRINPDTIWIHLSVHDQTIACAKYRSWIFAIELIVLIVGRHDYGQNDNHHYFSQY